MFSIGLKVPDYFSEYKTKVILRINKNKDNLINEELQNIYDKCIKPMTKKDEI